jgi:hypothetical protein
MLLLNREEAATYAFMLSRVYLQLDINHQVNLKTSPRVPESGSFNQLGTT